MACNYHLKPTFKDICGIDYSVLPSYILDIILHQVYGGISLLNCIVSALFKFQNISGANAGICKRRFYSFMEFYVIHSKNQALKILL